jgi:hypothetical protein
MPPFIDVEDNCSYFGDAVEPANPRPLTDRVTFSLTSCSVMTPGRDYAIEVWIHLDEKRDEILRRAKQSQGDDIRLHGKAGTLVARNTLITVQVLIPDLEVRDSEDTVYWDGEIGSATFPVHVPSNCTHGSHRGTALFHVDGIVIAKLHFVVEIGPLDKPTPGLLGHERHYRRAFASYASQDRDDVLARIQGILKVLPQLDIFFDVASLRSGEKWAPRLEQEIVAREVLYLFWSEHARKSEWVEREWRTALRHHGLTGIDPVPLVSPEEVPPAKELASELHFNDWTLAYRRSRSKIRRFTPPERDDWVW